MCQRFHLAKSLSSTDVKGDRGRLSHSSIGKFPKGCLHFQRLPEAYCKAVADANATACILHLQGIHYLDMHKHLQHESNTLICNLAGNAFHVWCCAGAMLASLILLSEAHATTKEEPTAELATAASSTDTSLLDQLWEQGCDCEEQSAGSGLWDPTAKFE